MSTLTLSNRFRLYGLLVALAMWPLAGNAQVAVAEVEAIDDLQSVSASELETLVGPIALYPDDLLAIVLPAATFPLQIVEAQRFLQALEDDPSLEPDEDWDDSVVALLNYPEVIDLLNEDLDWAWRLGEAVVAQQEDVIAAIELFRDRAYAAGNLKSDDYQLVAHEGSTIQITPVQEDVIYVPYYEPERVVVYQPRPVYYYYPRSYPVYYYPYPEYHPFHSSFFWGVTTAFSIGWHSHHLNVFHHSYYGHPYYGRSYWDYGWYRRPSINVYNTVYVRNNVNVSNNRNRDGDRWQSNGRRPVRASDQSIARTRYYPNSSSQGSSSANVIPSSNRSGTADSNGVRRETDREARNEIRFRERSDAPTTISNRPANQPRNRTGESARTQPSRQGESTKQEVRSTTTRQPQAKPSVTIRQPKSKPSTTIRQPQAKPSTTIRQPQAKPSTTIRQPQAKQSAPRQTQVRQSAPRPAQTRSTPQPRQSAPRVSSPRQSAPKVSSQRQSAPKVSAPSQPSRSSSGSSSNKSSGNSGRVSRNDSRKSDRDR